MTTRQRAYATLTHKTYVVVLVVFSTVNPVYAPEKTRE